MRSNSSPQKPPFEKVNLPEKFQDETARSSKAQEEKNIDLRNRRLVLRRQNQNREEKYSKSLTPAKSDLSPETRLEIPSEFPLAPNAKKVTAELQYLNGLALLEARDYGGALAQFTKILKNDPRGKYSSNALFAKGMTYKKMNLHREAKLVLTEVLQRFPKTTESVRAKAELALMGEMLSL